MAVIDLKNTIVKIYDGLDFDVTGIVQIPIVAVEGDLSIQAKIMASPDAPITFTMIKGTDDALATVVTKRSIVVTLETSGGTVITTADDIVAEIASVPAAFALIDLVAVEAGTGILEALSAISVTNPNSISIKIGEGNLTYSEKRPVEFKLDRGNLDTVREADQEPIDVSFEFTWEYISAESTSNVPTVEDALKRLDNASSWLNAASDPCRPDSVNISVDNDPTCASVEKEVTEITEFYHETLDHDIDSGQVSCAGRANNQYATSVRI
jgi:hypothetical protein